jgi:aminotransferase
VKYSADDEMLITVEVPVHVDTGHNGFKLTPELIEEHSGGKTKGIILYYPANPTWISYTGKELAAMQKVISRA